jgi:hypothetical protein
MVLRWIPLLQRHDRLGTYVPLAVHVVDVTAAGLVAASPRTRRLGRAVVVAAKRATRVMTERMFGY